ncbi:MAG: NYN domain-containing protein [Corallococcus sp.]|nr:NYN domain-containing protein [Corallococcus sp.]
MENKEYTFALLIDTDNVAQKYYEIMITELEEIGTVKIKRAYGDFGNGNPWKAKSIAEGIMPVQAFAQTKGKNSTDLVMVIDAMDLLYSNEVDAFCIATSDSDFARLAQRLKESGKYIVIAGEDKTPVSLSKSCDKFIMLDQLYAVANSAESATSGEAETNVTVPKVKTIKNVVYDIIANGKDAEGWMLFASVVSQLVKRYPQFNHKTYQAKDKQDFFKNKIGCEFKQEGTIVWIKSGDKQNNDKQKAKLKQSLL